MTDVATVAKRVRQTTTLVIFPIHSFPLLSSMSFSLSWQVYNFFHFVFLMSSFSLTIEPGRQVFALHAVVLLAKVSQNDWLCTQEVVERC